MRSLYKISIRALVARSLQETSWQDLCTDLYKSSVGKISARDLMARSLHRSSKGLLARSLYKASIRAFLARAVDEISVQARLKDLCKPQPTSGASLRNQMHANISQEPILYTEIYKKNPAAQNLGSHCVRTCTVDM